MALIVDTGPLYAALDRNDRDHAACARLLSRVREPVVVPAAVLVELDWLCGARLGPSAFDAVLGDVESGALRVEPMSVADYRRARALCQTYRDLPLGLVDASVIALAERLGEPKVATLDHRHFRVVRPIHVRSLKLVP